MNSGIKLPPLNGYLNSHIKKVSILRKLIVLKFVNKVRLTQSIIKRTANVTKIKNFGSTGNEQGNEVEFDVTLV